MISIVFANSASTRDEVALADGVIRRDGHILGYLPLHADVVQGELGRAAADIRIGIVGPVAA